MWEAEGHPLDSRIFDEQKKEMAMIYCWRELTSNHKSNTTVLYFHFGSNHMPCFFFLVVVSIFISSFFRSLPASIFNSNTSIIIRFKWWNSLTTADVQISICSNDIYIYTRAHELNESESSCICSRNMTFIFLIIAIDCLEFFRWTRL